jgi:polysaccharide export outer membrane protein
LLGPGDLLEIFYTFETKPTTEAYRLAVGDIFRVEFLYHPEMNRNISVLPDGRAILPLKGELKVDGLTPTELDAEITRLFSDTYQEPVVTVTLLEFNQPMVQFQKAIKSDRRGQGRLGKIRPDGYVGFPLIDDIKASGITVPQLLSIVTEKYREKVENVSISLMLEEANSNLVYVLGEVKRPDFYKMDSPTTVSQILSRAQIIVETAEMSSILVISRTRGNQPVGRIFNFEEVLAQANIGKDFLLKQYDVVYVPKTKIERVGVFVEQYVNRLVPRFFRFGVGYNINDEY